jgi:aspartyl-tRNA(Asn)/glutamyl-tRNA(Gln) amidotransferase subunit B
MKNENFFPVIGLEVHVELRTNSKMFCGCPSFFGAAPNTNICPVCTGQPGALPVINGTGIELAVKAALGLNCRINPVSVFARKNYFYPDLPKNYQISQYEQPLGENGRLGLYDGKKRVRVKRVHLEEDTGKLLHSIGSRELDYSLVDFNRSGIPLLEIVTEPDIFSIDDAYEYLTVLRNVLRYADISECDMEKGTLRCDANISVLAAEEGETPGIKDRELGVKTEIKNMNSFKAVREALAYEFERQVSVLQEGGKIRQETRLWDDKSGVTALMRSKEEAHDYRYFPEPDLLPMNLSDEFVANIRNTLPELPQARKKRFMEGFELSEYAAGVLTAEKSLAEYFEKTIGGDKESAREATAWITTELMGRLNSAGKGIEESPVSPEHLSKLIKLIRNNTISGKIAKMAMEEMFDTGADPEEIIRKKGLAQISDEDSITAVIDEIMKANQKAVDEYRCGKSQAIGALIGAAMKKTGGRVNPQKLRKIMKEKLEKSGS